MTANVREDREAQRCCSSPPPSAKGTPTNPSPKLPFTPTAALRLSVPPAEPQDGTTLLVRIVYHRIDWQTVRIVVCVASSALFLVGVSKGATWGRQVWYHTSEGIIAAVFLVEVCWRGLIAGWEFLLYPLNVVELIAAWMCFVCLTTFSIVASAGVLSDVVLAVINLLQVTRVLLSCRHSYVAIHDDQVELNVRTVSRQDFVESGVEEA